MSPTPTCVHCGATLSGASPGGLCPACLLRGALTLDEAAIALPRLGQDNAAAADSAADSSPHRFGDYELQAEIASGGMGRVFRARQLSLNRVVALKLLLGGRLACEEFRERFRIEAQAAATLQHPNIVAIHEVGEHEGQLFFSMDLVDGPNLMDLVREQPLAAERAAAWVKTLAEAVEFAHQRGILHRDIKPSNILVDAFGQPRITDFGLAKRLTEASDLTVTGQVLGSPNYIAPEQAEGRNRDIGKASDIYSLGAVLYYLLTRRPPFHADKIALLLRQVSETEPISPHLLNASVPRDLETICLKCLEKAPGKRYATARELAQDLGRFLDGQPIHARPVCTLGAAWKWSCRKPMQAGLGAALAAAILTGMSGVVWQWRRAERNAAQEIQQRLRSERSEFAADMMLAQLTLAKGDLGQTIQLLNNHRPAARSALQPHQRRPICATGNGGTSGAAAKATSSSRCIAIPMRSTAWHFHRMARCSPFTRVVKS